MFKLIGLAVLALVAVIAIVSCKSTPTQDADVAAIQADWAQTQKDAGPLIAASPAFAKFAAEVSGGLWLQAAVDAPAIVTLVTTTGGPLLADVKKLFGDLEKYVSDVITNKVNQPGVKAVDLRQENEALDAIRSARAKLEL